MWNSLSRVSPASGDSWKMDTGASMFCHNNWCAITIAHQSVHRNGNHSTIVYHTGMHTWPQGLGTTGYLNSALQWRHNGHDSVSNHQPHGCLLNRLFRRRSKKTSNLRVTGLCAGKSPGTPVNSPHKWPVTRKCFHLMTSSLKNCSKFETAYSVVTWPPPISN